VHHDRPSPRKRNLVPFSHVIVLAAALLLGGCRMMQPQPQAHAESTPIGPAGFNAMQLHAAVVSYADNLVTAAAEALDKAAAAAPSPRDRVDIKGDKVALASSAHSIASDMNPIGSVLDMVALVSLSRSATESEESRRLYGPFAAEVTDVFRRFEETAFNLADDALSPEQLGDLRAFIDQWRADHPAQRSVAFVRLREFSDFRGEIRLSVKGPKSLLGLFMLDPLANLDPTAREIQQTRMLADRITLYLKRAPVLLGWELDWLTAQFAAQPEVIALLEDVDRFGRTAEQIASTAEALPDRLRETIAGEREAIIEAFDAQTDQFLVRLGEEAPRLDGLAEKLSRLSDSVRQTLETVQAMHSQSAGKPPSDAAPVEIEDVRATLADTGAAADRLNELVRSVNELLDADRLRDRQARIDETLALVEARGERILDRAFRLGALLVVLVLAASIVRMLVQRRLAVPRTAG
jgi:hypothetical protein